MTSTDIILMTAAFGLAIFGLGVWDEQRKHRAQERQLKLNYPPPSQGREHEHEDEKRPAMV